jgi:DNA-3-methyladenine glycosylase
MTAGLPWTLGIVPADKPLGPLHGRPVTEVARMLLGCRLISTIDGVATEGVIVETEAYDGPTDPASHAATASGATARNRAMFGPPGRAYVYRSYGMHWCMNVVSGWEGEAQAVLLRGLAPLVGEEVMRRRRHGRLPLTAGPGRLCEALGITDAMYGHDLSVPPLELRGGWSLTEELIGSSGRVGVRRAARRQYRFYVRGAPGVSRPDGWRSKGHTSHGMHA